MADKDITQDANLTSNTAPALTDRIIMVDAGTGTVQDITPDNLLKSIALLTSDTNPDIDADSVAAYDNSGSTASRILLSNLPVKKIKETSTLLTVGSITDGQYLKRSGSTIISATAASSTKGRVEILAALVPATLGAPLRTVAGASSPAESYSYFEFADAALAYRDFECRLIGYQGGGLTLKFELLRTSAAAAAGYYFQAAIRRINTGTEDITASHSYDYNSVTVTVPAGPPAAGIPMAGTITFTDGADMDSLADGEAFMLRFRRDPTNGADNAGDAARVLTTITISET